MMDSSGIKVCVWGGGRTQKMEEREKETRQKATLYNKAIINYHTTKEVLD